ncbi:MAG: gamma-glutamyl-gamma-aminobutyrate hydrolase family protein [Ktedonobacteraceae bacterium]|nr:gamma-glutamyl-gamma-aminobutyrate hydrolase family protein [Ktedonobacteraceae bacterium]
MRDAYQYNASSRGYLHGMPPAGPAHFRRTGDFDGLSLPASLASLVTSQQPGQLPTYYRPRIGLLSSSGCMRDGGWPVYAGDAATVNAIFEAGGDPIVMPTLPLMQGYDPLDILTDDDAFEEVFRIVWPLVRNLDGLVLTGGGDLYSCLYGHPLHPQTDTPELWRDIWERYFALLAWILCIPTLGICRGMQVMNAVRGGGLFQDIRSQWPKNMPPLVPHRARGRISADNWVEHPIAIHPKSRLARLVRGRDERIPYRQYIEAVLSMHHQIVGYVTPDGEIVGYLAPGMGIGATAPDGVIEAIEDLDPRRFWVAVQFHPEWIVYLGWALSLFSSHIDACYTYAALDLNTLDSYLPEVRDWLRQCDATLTHRPLPDNPANRIEKVFAQPEPHTEFSARGPITDPNQLMDHNVAFEQSQAVWG